MMTNRLKLACCCMALLFFCAVAFPVHAETAKELFDRECASCHSIGGGRLVGPDLKGVTTKKDRAWLMEFTINPEAMFNKGDEYALKLKSEYNDMIMPAFPGLTKERVEALLVYIESQSQGVGAQASLPRETTAEKISFSADDVNNGMNIFLGVKQLKNGGAACLSCHSTSSIKTPGGGNLGPDLTKVAERLGGERALMAWMSSSPSRTMRPIYQKRPLEEDEVHAVVAFLVAEKEHEAQAGGFMKFLGLGIIGAVAGIVLFAVIWGKRFRAVRSPLVEG
jgi:mono/diheme cytochrome c family protein